MTELQEPSFMMWNGERSEGDSTGDGAGRVAVMTGMSVMGQRLFYEDRGVMEEMLNKYTKEKLWSC